MTMTTVAYILRNSSVKIFRKRNKSIKIYLDYEIISIYTEKPKFIIFAKLRFNLGKNV